MDEILRDPALAVGVGALLASFIGTLIGAVIKLFRQGGQIQNVTDQTDKLLENYRKLADELNEAKDENKQLNEAIQRLENAAVAREARYKDEQIQRDILERERVNAYEQQIQYLKGRVDELSKQNLAAQETSEKRIEQIVTLNRKIDEQTLQIEKIKESANKQGLELEEVKKKLEVAEYKSAELVTENRLLIAENQRLATENVRLQTENQRLRGLRPENPTMPETGMLTLPPGEDVETEKPEKVNRDA